MFVVIWKGKTEACNQYLNVYEPKMATLQPTWRWREGGGTDGKAVATAN